MDCGELQMEEGSTMSMRAPPPMAMGSDDGPMVMHGRPTTLPSTRVTAEVTIEEARVVFKAIMGHEIFKKPPSTLDSWHEMNGGWIIRYHRKTRKRGFHPLRRGKGAPIPSDLIPYRMTVQFNREGERRFWLGQWMDSTWSSPGTWVGYSVFKHRDAVQGGELCDGGGCGDEVQPPIRPPIQMTSSEQQTCNSMC